MIIKYHFPIGRFLINQCPSLFFLQMGMTPIGGILIDMLTEGAGFAVLQMIIGLYNERPSFQFAFIQTL
ncbi:MAG: hypothetical protein DA408_18260 [Bacteroidetes bacterium]|nr:MAG: hypothetical protein C7N36_04975 [Bacteroidota bacterium]PTM09482.1 MAG: hypothetical protein DA408_18260 [Bacteroidota bacterium]